MDLAIELIETKKSVIRCDGEGCFLGHPVVYLNLGTEGKVICPYCSRCYVKALARSMTDKKTRGLRRIS